MKHGKLYLLPTPLGENSRYFISPDNVELIEATEYFIVEKVRTSRRFIRSMSKKKDIDGLTFFEINKFTADSEAANILVPLLNGYNSILMSEAGCPGIADPGAKVVASAHELGITVVPIIGPSSIIMALMASGCNGQSFTFLGYLPVKRSELVRKLKEIEMTSFRKKEAQIFIETPYRNEKMLEVIIETCKPTTRLCVACDLSLPTESIKTYEVKKWQQTRVDGYNKRPVVFIIN